jgi:hypothetical protein
MCNCSIIVYITQLTLKVKALYSSTYTDILPCNLKGKQVLWIKVHSLAYSSGCIWPSNAFRYCHNCSCLLELYIACKHYVDY